MSTRVRRVIGLDRGKRCSADFLKISKQTPALLVFWEFVNTEIDR